MLHRHSAWYLLTTVCMTLRVSHNCAVVHMNICSSSWTRGMSNSSHGGAFTPLTVGQLLDYRRADCPQKIIFPQIMSLTILSPSLKLLILMMSILLGTEIVFCLLLAFG